MKTLGRTKILGVTVPWYLDFVDFWLTSPFTAKEMGKPQKVMSG
jgi:hypothetical protein